MIGNITMHNTISVKGRNILKYIILVGISIFLLFPMLYMLVNSFMDNKEVLKTYAALFGADTMQNTARSSIGFKLVPDKVSLLQYYNVLLRKPKFLIMFWNSVIVTFPIMLGQIVVSTFAAFAFGKLRFPFRNEIFFIYVIVMLMPYQVTLVPNYIMLKQLSLLGTYLAVILPGIFATFGVFLLRQFMSYIPDEYSEAAIIDGAGYFTLFSRVILPQCKGAVASLAILVFVDNWNMVEQPLIFLKDETMHPLSIFLSKINTGDIGIAFACGILYMLPPVFIFLYGENYLIEGIQLSGLK